MDSLRKARTTIYYSQIQELFDSLSWQFCPSLPVGDIQISAEVGLIICSWPKVATRISI